MNAVLETAQFDTVEAALRFAFRQNRENYQLSLLNRMASTPGGPGRGLGGLEGAGTAGIICRHVKALGFGPEAILRAKYGQRESNCRHCLNGRVLTEWWQEAIAEVTTFSAAAVTVSKYQLRHGLVRRYFGVKVDIGGARINIDDLARRCEVPTRTAEEHWGKIKQFLKHHEGAAFHAISANLREAGIVYSAD